jgi:hypothetical protein
VCKTNVIPNYTTHTTVHGGTNKCYYKIFIIMTIESSKWISLDPTVAYALHTAKKNQARITGPCASGSVKPVLLAPKKIHCRYASTSFPASSGGLNLDAAENRGKQRGAPAHGSVRPVDPKFSKTDDTTTAGRWPRHKIYN